MVRAWHAVRQHVWPSSGGARRRARGTRLPRLVTCIRRRRRDCSTPREGTSAPSATLCPHRWVRAADRRLSVRSPVRIRGSLLSSRSLRV